MNAQSVSMNIDTGEKTWLTPQWIIDVLGAFDLDPCCPDGENHDAEETPRPQNRDAWQRSGSALRSSRFRFVL